ncbi:M15 family metallopeptidase [uncultured Shewanella sp.]|uniref:M15 family metallopeptidase n=1 Tax=uncultured Shewanella sp. TaxID=173975 RepID=UPI0026357188|nr:M15 family metallopeptidase [uncultured Shewanella sp.]
MRRFKGWLFLCVVMNLLLVQKVIADDMSGFDKKKFDDDCAPQSRLATIGIHYYDFDGVRQQGTITTLDTIAGSLKQIFSRLYRMEFPIYHADASLIPDDAIDSDIDSSENLNNTASYACRVITGGGDPSVHAYGGAIDINPRENPYIGFNLTDDPDVRVVREIIPTDGWKYITRGQFREQKDEHQGIVDGIVDVFKNHGILRWGGDWNSPIDYMHFEIYRDNAILFLTMNKIESIRYFNQYTAFYHTCKKVFPQEYKKRNFSDLSRAIASHAGDMPVDIYIDRTRGFDELMMLSGELLDNPTQEDCLYGANTSLYRYEQPMTEINSAVSKIDALRAIKH